MTIDIYQDATTQHEHSGYLDLQIDHSAVRELSMDELNGIWRHDTDSRYIFITK